MGESNRWPPETQTSPAPAVQGQAQEDALRTVNLSIQELQAALDSIAARVANIKASVEERSRQPRPEAAENDEDGEWASRVANDIGSFQETLGDLAEQRRLFEACILQMQLTQQV
jgi:hypothetical protein